jgi:hypothetical protein
MTRLALVCKQVRIDGFALDEVRKPARAITASLTS